MGLLEVAEYFARTPNMRPARSLLFVWHASEEVGLWGSEWFTDHPAVPRDSIASAINIDMIGRGAASDVPNGGDKYLQLLGSRRLSSAFGDFIEAVNTQAAHRFALDYTYDANGHPQQYYCRSDHWNYARYGIPTVFFSTGGHADYHMVTDEPQYLDYPHFERVTRFVADIARAAGNQKGRWLLDKPVPGPQAQCVQ
jgi:Zn-dependent M28 family amino/carboxypeptidase